MLLKIPQSTRESIKGATDAKPKALSKAKRTTE